jgi:ClpP class serine protease
MVAVANTQASSAAYWLGSQAHEVVVSPSGEIGSIGVYQVHRDASKAFEGAGIRHTLVKAGKFKTEGNPYEPLGDEARDAAQQAVNDYYGMFVSDVARGRGVAAEDVTDGYGEGRQLTAKRAVKAGLADRVATLGQTVSRLASGRASVKQTQAGEFEISWGDDDNGSVSATPPAEAPVVAAASGMSEEEKRRLAEVLLSR